MIAIIGVALLNILIAFIAIMIYRRSSVEPLDLPVISFTNPALENNAQINPTKLIKEHLEASHNAFIEIEKFEGMIPKTSLLLPEIITPHFYKILPYLEPKTSYKIRFSSDMQERLEKNLSPLTSDDKVMVKENSEIEPLSPINPQEDLSHEMIENSLTFEKYLSELNRGIHTLRYDIKSIKKQHNHYEKLILIEKIISWVSLDFTPHLKKIDNEPWQLAQKEKLIELSKDIYIFQEMLTKASHKIEEDIHQNIINDTHELNKKLHHHWFGTDDVFTKLNEKCTELYRLSQDYTTLTQLANLLNICLKILYKNEHYFLLTLHNEISLKLIDYAELIHIAAQKFFDHNHPPKHMNFISFAYDESHNNEKRDKIIHQSGASIALLIQANYDYKYIYKMIQKKHVYHIFQHTLLITTDERGRIYKINLEP